MKTIGKTLVVLMFISAGVAAFRSHWDRPVVPMVSRALAAKGDVGQVVTATETLAPARSVAVGSQVSGVVKRLHVDYNAVVKKGEVLAEIDPEKAKTQLESAEASLTQAESSLESDSPIDGVVVSRDVDEGQTVNASVASPTIYELASDLTSMQLAGAIDEADVAAVKPGQTARFTLEISRANAVLRVPVKLGLTDGTWVEVTGGELNEGDDVITAVTVPSKTGAGPAAAPGNPLTPPPPRFGGRGGF